MESAPRGIINNLGTAVAVIRLHPTINAKKDSTKDSTIHESLLTLTPTVLSDALRTTPLRHGRHVIPLVWDDFGIFEIYRLWLYERTIYTKFAIESNGKADLRTEQARAKDTYKNLLGCWILGQTIRDVRFKDAVMSEMVGKVGAYRGMPRQLILCLEHGIVKKIFDATIRESMLREFLFEVIAQFGTREDLQHFSTETRYPADFVRGILVPLVRVRDEGKYDVTVPGKQPEWARNPCYYHEHVRDGEGCWRRW